jgi:hypothetical protein
MNRLPYILGAVALVALAGAGAWWWQQRAERDAPPPVPEAATTSTSVAAAVAPAPASAPIRHPLEAAAPAHALPEPVTVDGALTHLFGRKAVLSMFQLDDFPRRLVATVDNLGRGHASARLLPVNPPEGRFTVQESARELVISPDNGLRYTPYVLLLETVDLRQAVAAYRALYPLFQQAYEELGYPRSYFNDRLVDVIDHLLVTPEPAGPLAVRLPEIKGPIQPERPWVLYQFADPALESLSAGQKLMLRIGPVNQRRVKAKLEEIRRLVSASTPAPR